MTRPLPNDMPIEYPAMVPPWLDEMPESFATMRKKEALRHLEWYVAQTEPRLELLFRAVKATNGPIDALDYSFQSLDPLWDWASQFFGYMLRPKAEVEAGMRALPDFVAEDATEVDFAGPAPGNIVLAPDIGFYVFEVWKRYSDQPYWGLGKLVKNAPTILGWPLKSEEYVPMLDIMEEATNYSKDGGTRDKSKRSKFRRLIESKAGRLKRRSGLPHTIL